MISVITVCYNSAKTIKKTFDSILEQSSPPAEYIVIDGNSQDDTVVIIKDYEEKFFGKNIRFKWISENDKGIYDAMNKGVLYTTQKWIHFLNSDDYYINKYIVEAIIEKLRNTTADIVYGELIKIENGIESALTPPKEKRLKLNSLISCPIYQPATFFSASLLKSNYSFDTAFKISADYKLFVHMIHEGVKFRYIPMFITYFNDGGISSVNQKTLTYNEDIKVLREFKRTTVFMRLKAIRLFYKPVILFFQLISKF
jgi:glycosyltransferase involved in cell wall biosynthesis